MIDQGNLRLLKALEFLRIWMWLLTRAHHRSHQMYRNATRLVWMFDGWPNPQFCFIHDSIRKCFISRCVRQNDRWENATRRHHKERIPLRAKDTPGTFSFSHYSLLTTLLTHRRSPDTAQMVKPVFAPRGRISALLENPYPTPFVGEAPSRARTRGQPTPTVS